jgi:glutamate racemase
MNHDARPIGMFDSGVGGLSVLREITGVLPHESIVYVADQQWSPYGRLTIEEVRERAFDIAGGLIANGAKMVVVACNSASAAALHALREHHPEIPFVGMEPAVKPAALQSRNGVIGVLATSATFQGELFATVVDRHANHVTVLPRVGTGLVGLVENDGSGTDAARELLADHLQPLLDEGIDTLVLGCTHYPFLVEDIRGIVGEQVEVIDPSPAVARQVQRVLADAGTAAPADQVPSIRYATTGDPDRFGSMIEKLLSRPPVTRPTVW